MGVIAQSLNDLCDNGVRTPEPWLSFVWQAAFGQEGTYFFITMSVRGDWKFLKQTFSLKRYAGSQEAWAGTIF